MKPGAAGNTPGSQITAFGKFGFAQMPIHQNATARNCQKIFKLDIRGKMGTRYFFGTTDDKGAVPGHLSPIVSSAWSVTAVMGVVALTGWLLGWSVGMLVALLVVVTALLAITFLVEHRARLNSQSIIIDVATGTLIIPKALPAIQGAYHLEDLILSVRSDSPGIATSVVTRDYYVVVEGELERDHDAVSTFEVKLIGPGYLPEMNGKADELRSWGRWRSKPSDN